MNTVKEWTTFICLSAIAGGMIEIIAPSDKMEKIIKFVLGAFMMCIIAIPFSKLCGDISYDFSNYRWEKTKAYEYESKLDGQLETLVSQKISSLVDSTLKNADINYKKVDVIMDKSEDNSISIIKINLFFDKSDIIHSDKAKNLIEEKLGLETNCLIY